VFHSLPIAVIRNRLFLISFVIALAANLVLLGVAYANGSPWVGYLVMLVLLIALGGSRCCEIRPSKPVPPPDTMMLSQIERRRQRLESLGTLASGIAHDLNNLLTPILMSGKMLQRETPNLDRAALVDTIVSGASRGADLIAQLLTFARGGDGVPARIALSELLPEIVRILERTVGGEIEVVLDVQPDLPDVIGDETELSQVVMNLAINGRDAMDGAGRLSVRARSWELSGDRSFSYTVLPPGRYVMVSVTDTGRGMEDAIRDRIFEPFFSTKQRGQGTGLGLSTTIGIIKSHGGAIEVDSVLGEGTTINVILPIATS